MSRHLHLQDPRVFQALKITRQRLALGNVRDLQQQSLDLLKEQGHISQAEHASGTSHLRARSNPTYNMPGALQNLQRLGFAKQGASVEAIREAMLEGASIVLQSSWGMVPRVTARVDGYAENLTEMENAQNDIGASAVSLIAQFDHEPSQEVSKLLKQAGFKRNTWIFATRRLLQPSLYGPHTFALVVEKREPTRLNPTRWKKESREYKRLQREESLIFTVGGASVEAARRAATEADELRRPYRKAKGSERLIREELKSIGWKGPGKGIQWGSFSTRQQDEAKSGFRIVLQYGFKGPYTPEWHSVTVARNRGEVAEVYSGDNIYDAIAAYKKAYYRLIAPSMAEQMGRAPGGWLEPMVRTGVRRNPSFFDPRLNPEGMPTSTPTMLQRMIVRIFKQNRAKFGSAREALDYAFPVSVSILQKNGYIVPGTRDVLTAKGRIKEDGYSGAQRNEAISAYEAALASARTSAPRVRRGRKAESKSKRTGRIDMRKLPAEIAAMLKSRIQQGISDVSDLPDHIKAILRAAMV